ncbi:MAG: histidine triad nucleotide-binding protein [Candidatus Eiseniibacteriota bacterium]
MSHCIFCRIAAGEIPARRVLEDDDVVAFHDANPQAPVHVLVVPRRHVASISELSPDDQELSGRLLDAAIRVAQTLDLAGPGKGYRLVINTGPDGGQSVFHVHVHVLGGRALAWPPG